MVSCIVISHETILMKIHTRASTCYTLVQLISICRNFTTYMYFNFIVLTEISFLENWLQSSEWMKHSTPNNLSDVYQHYCKGAPLKKDMRNVFVKGTMADVQADFQVRRVMVKDMLKIL